MRSFIVGLGAGVRRGENEGGVEMRAVAAGGITGVCGTLEGGDIFGGAAGGVGCATGVGAGGVGTGGLGSAGFGSSGAASDRGFCGVAGGGAEGIVGGVAVTVGTGADGVGETGFCSGAGWGFSSAAGIIGAAGGLIGGWTWTRGGTVIGEGISTCG
jgi:hypothetical protein